MTQIVWLILDNQEHGKHIRIREEQRKEFGSKIDLTIQDLEIEAIQVKIDYLRYKAEKLEILRKSIESSS